MPSMTIKSIPDKLYKTLKRNARINHRSLNGETIACLERSLGMTHANKQETLSRIDSIRNTLKSVKLTEKALNTAKSVGRK